MPSTTDTSTYRMNHSMIRIKDPKVTVSWYEDVLGLKLLRKAEQSEAKFDLYFLGYDHENTPSKGRDMFDREALIELTHNYGTENDPDFKVNNGNEEPHLGFGHFCITTDNLPAACRRLESKGVKFLEKWNDEDMSELAFIQDPDGYRIKIVGQTPNDADVKESNTTTYSVSHTMLRVKDLERSRKYYQDVLGMSLFRSDTRGDKTVNFVGYPGHQGASLEETDVRRREGMLELSYTHGTEKKEGFAYHNGNDQPQGFGHICVTVDNLEAACGRFEEKGVNWKKRPSDGRMKHVAFILDPDGYWIEIVQNDIDKK